MRVLSYSELKRKITHLYSLHYSLGFIPIAIVTGAATKRNTNVSKELSNAAPNAANWSDDSEERESQRSLEF